MANTTSTIPLQVHYKRESRKSHKDSNGHYTRDYVKWLQTKIYGLYYRIQVTDKINGLKTQKYINTLKDLKNCDVTTQEGCKYINIALEEIPKTKISDSDRKHIKSRIHTHVPSDFKTKKYPLEQS
jgi:hypothetical protein